MKEQRNNANKKKKSFVQKRVSLVVCLLIGASLGFLGGHHIGSLLSGKALPEQLTALARLALGTVAAMYIQIVIHETGHLIFGILTGYKFSSFRIGRFMLLIEQDKAKLKRISVTGTAGQCLMVPPAVVDGKFPFMLYNLGGALLNAATGLLFWRLSVTAQGRTQISDFLLILGIVGFVVALTNGIPMRFGTVDNDAYNALSLSQNREAAHSFWMQLDIQGQIAEGRRLKDMPSEWFYIPSDDGMKNSMTAAMGVLYCNRLMDMHSFKEAYRVMSKLLEVDSAIVGLHRNLMNCDRIYCELIGENDNAQVAAMQTKDQKRLMKAMRNFLSVLRTEYAYAALAEKDARREDEIKKLFEKKTRAYPYQGDIESERELVHIAECAARKIEPGESPGSHPRTKTPQHIA